MVNLYSEFLEAERVISDILGLTNPKIENMKYDTPKIGVDYISRVTGNNLKFNFHLRTDSNKIDPLEWSSLSLSLSFYNEFDVCQLYEHKRFRYPEKVKIPEWASGVAKTYNYKKKNNDLEFLFGNIDIRVRGLAGITNATFIEFIINLKGYLSWGADRLIVYRFNHGTGKDKGFSYAFLIECKQFIYNYSFWCVFPDFVGMSGGTGYGGYKEVESLLKEANKNVEVKIFDIYISTGKFLKFLQKKNVTFISEPEYLDSSKSEKVQFNEKDVELLRENQVLDSFVGETTKNIAERSCKPGKHSLSHPPGDIKDRVFIGGDYKHPSVLREIEKFVISLGFQPIIALDFDIPPEEINRSCKMLLHVSKYAIFEVSSSSGQLVELDRTIDYDVDTLVVFQIIAEEEKPRISAMITSLKIEKQFGYKDFEDLKAKISEFLSTN